MFFLNGEKKNEILFLSDLPCVFSSLLTVPSGLKVMFNQRDSDRTFPRDKVNRTMRGLTKLLTPQQLNMNKRCALFKALYNAEHF